MLANVVLSTLALAGAASAAVSNGGLKLLVPGGDNLWWSACCFSFVMGGPTGHGLPLCPRLCGRLYDIRGDPDFCQFLGKLAKNWRYCVARLVLQWLSLHASGLLYSVRRMSRPSLTSSRLSSPRQCADPIILYQSPASPTTSSGPAARAPSPSSPCGASFLHSYLIHTAN